MNRFLLSMVLFRRRSIDDITAGRSHRSPLQFDYMMNCQGCHLPDGAGFPAHVTSRLVAGNLGNFLRVDGGREFLVRVPGSAQSDLGDARLAAVLNWMLVSYVQRRATAKRLAALRCRRSATAEKNSPDRGDADAPPPDGTGRGKSAD